MRMWNEHEANYFLDFIENEAASVFNETELACGGDKFCYMNFPKTFRLESHGGPNAPHPPLRSAAQEFAKLKRLHRDDKDFAHAATCDSNGNGECPALVDAALVVKEGENGEEVDAAGGSVEAAEAEEMKRKRETGYLLRHPMKGWVGVRSL
jgi:hypothetical protein